MKLWDGKIQSGTDERDSTSRGVRACPVCTARCARRSGGAPRRRRTRRGAGRLSTLGTPTSPWPRPLPTLILPLRQIGYFTELAKQEDSDLRAIGRAGIQQQQKLVGLGYKTHAGFPNLQQTATAPAVNRHSAPNGGSRQAAGRHSEPNSGCYGALMATVWSRPGPTPMAEIRAPQSSSSRVT